MRRDRLVHMECVDRNTDTYYVSDSKGRRAYMAYLCQGDIHVCKTAGGYPQPEDAPLVKEAQRLRLMTRGIL